MNIVCKELDVLPLIKYYIEELEVVKTFESHLEPVAAKNVDIPYSEVLALLIANIVTATKPLYEVQEWLANYIDGRGEDINKASKLNDDRLGRALDTLYKADRNSLMFALSGKAIEVHKLETSRIHNDTTSITFAGDYTNQPEASVDIVHGHNKDGRPNDKQIIFGINITEDGHVPISYNIYNGNQNDDTTHQPNWDALRDFLGKTDFIYTADCKLCSYDNLAHIHENGGKFVTLIPAYYNESKNFIEKVKAGVQPLDWGETFISPSQRKDSQPNYFKVLEAKNSKEGYRVIWVYNSVKDASEKSFRCRGIEKADTKLKEIERKLNKRNLKDKKSIEKAVSTATKGVGKLFNIEITENKSIKLVHLKKGRPSKSAQPIEVETVLYGLNWDIDSAAIEKEERADGLYPLITNTDLKPVEVLKTYKKQPHLEKKFFTTKSVLEIAPVFLKKPERIEAIILLYFIALMIVTLIERRIRKQMKENEIDSLPILPSNMKTKTPTWRAIRSFCRSIYLQVVEDSEGKKSCCIKGLKQHHEQVFQLLGIPDSYYANLTDNWLQFS